MKRVVLILIFLQGLVQAQTQYTLLGIITDEQSSEPLYGVVIKEQEQGKKALTGLDGDFVMKLNEGTHTLVFSGVGYKEKTQVIELTADQTITFKLQSDSYELEDVVIEIENEEENITSTEIGVQELDIEEIKKIPPLLGEVDVVKSLELLPGVTTVGEGASGFNVRGGTIDQNLVLMDYAPIYSSSHLFGFFSVFNSDAVRSLKLYKGGIPSRFGGRISSVLDVRQTSGNRDSMTVKGGVGVVSGRIFASTPLNKGKGSMMLAARRSWADLFLKASNDEGLRNTQAYFYDLNGKVEYDLGKNDQVSLTGYYGRDVFGFRDQFRFDWGNTAISSVWTHKYGEKLVSDVSGYYTNYDYSVGSGTIFQVRSKIKNYGLNIKYEYYLSDKHTVRFGLDNVYYDIFPGSLTGDDINDAFLEKEFGYEVSPYLSDEWKVSKKFTVLGGIRYSGYMHLGPRTIKTYQDGAPVSDETVVSETQYERGQVTKYYGGLEPRLAATFQVDSSSSLKMGYNRTRQYIHLVSNTSNGLPIDAWKLSDQNVSPVVADQISLGYFRNFKDNMFETSVEVYYKDMRNVLDYKNGADLIFQENLETQIIAGQGKSFGLELFVKKKKGRLTGWISYTLSRSLRKTNSPYVDEMINNNEWYSANYDKPNDVSVVLSYELSKRLTIASTFQYSTGKPVTVADTKNLYEGIATSNAGRRNITRMPAYHRVDLSATLYPKNYKNKKFKSYWVLAIYNVYGRKNPYSYNFRVNEANPSIVDTYQISILGTILPAITYNFEF